jgi:hypothetical protein
MPALHLSITFPTSYSLREVQFAWIWTCCLGVSCHRKHASKCRDSCDVSALVCSPRGTQRAVGRASRSNHSSTTCNITVLKYSPLWCVLSFKTNLPKTQQRSILAAFLPFCSYRDIISSAFSVQDGKQLAAINKRLRWPHVQSPACPSPTALSQVPALCGLPACLMPWLHVVMKLIYIPAYRGPSFESWPQIFTSSLPSFKLRVRFAETKKVLLSLFCSLHPPVTILSHILHHFNTLSFPTPVWHASNAACLVIPLDDECHGVSAYTAINVCIYSYNQVAPRMSTQLCSCGHVYCLHTQV